MQALATYLRPAAVTYTPPPNGNTGIVPPWLQKPLVPPPYLPPAGDQTPRVLGAATAYPTLYDPAPAPADPDEPWHIM